MNCGKVATFEGGWPKCPECGYEPEKVIQFKIGGIVSDASVDIDESSRDYPVLKDLIPVLEATLPSSKKNRSSLCKQKEVFKCTASELVPADGCRYFSPDVFRQGQCISMGISLGTRGCRCLNPTAKAEALAEQVSTAEKLSARIVDTQAGSPNDIEKLEQLLRKAAEKFRWDKEDESEDK
jgi:hypothetical protein